MSESTIIPSAHSRRSALRAGLAAFAGGAFGLPALSQAVNATPSMTQGPYWVDEKLNRSDIRSDPSTGALTPGFQLNLNIGVVKLVGNTTKVVKGAMVDVWHCNAYGEYSDEPAGMGQSNTQGQKWLRGYQTTGSAGTVRFTTIYPGWYGGRTTHIHARVRTFSGTTTTTNFTTQFFFDDTFTDKLYARQKPYRYRTATRTTKNANDNIYNAVTKSSGSTTANPDGAQCTLKYSADYTHVYGSFQIVLI